jgi:hypothetical protein
MVDKVTPDTAEQIRAHGYKQGRLIEQIGFLSGAAGFNRYSVSQTLITLGR